MKILVGCLSVLIILSYSTNVYAQNYPTHGDIMPFVVQVFSQAVKIQLPQGWKPVDQSTSDGHFMTQFVPQGQTAELWTTMFTLEGLRDFEFSIVDVLIFLAEHRKEFCGDNLIFELVEEKPISGYPAQGAIIGCSTDLTGSAKKEIAEIAYYIAVKGDKDMYIFHKTTRYYKSEKLSSLIKKQNMKKFINDFMPIEIVKSAK